MTDKQQKFADEYIIDCNASRAYKAAYPRVKKDSVAQAAGSRLLLNVKVKSYIDERLEKISSEKVADAKEVMEYLTSVMRGRSQSEIVSDARRMSKAPDEKERLKAAEMLGKRYGLFTDKSEVSMTAAVSVEDYLKTLDDD